MVNTMVADALAPCVARTSVSMILTMHYLVLLEEGFQLLVLCQCEGMSLKVNICFVPSENVARKGLKKLQYEESPMLPAHYRKYFQHV